MKFVQFVNRRREDVSMYWNATRFLWHVFTHPKNPLSHPRNNPVARATERQAKAAAASPYRGFVTAPSPEVQLAKSQARLADAKRERVL